jgi:hypothetical protein
VRPGATVSGSPQELKRNQVREEDAYEADYAASREGKLCVAIAAGSCGRKILPIDGIKRRQKWSKREVF